MYIATYDQMHGNLVSPLMCTKLVLKHMTLLQVALKGNLIHANKSHVFFCVWPAYACTCT